MMKHLKMGALFFVLLCVGGCGYLPESGSKEGDTKEYVYEEDSVYDNEYIQEMQDINFMAEYSTDEGYVSSEIMIDIVPVRTLGEGILYKVDGECELPFERLPIYLYATEDKIYRLWTPYDEIDLLLSEEQVLQESTVVCQEDELPDCLGEEDEGQHHYIAVGENESIRESHLYSYNDYANVVGYWEAFYWEKGVGLIQYRSGFAAEADMLSMIIKK